MSLSSHRGRSWLLFAAVLLLLVGLTVLAVPAGVPLPLALGSVTTGMTIVIAGAALLALWVGMRP